MFLTIPLAGVHFAGLLNTMIRWQQGIPIFPTIQSFNPLKGDWLPPLGPYVPIGLGAIAAILIIIYAAAA